MVVMLWFVCSAAMAVWAVAEWMVAREKAKGRTPLVEWRVVE